MGTGLGGRTSAGTSRFGGRFVFGEGNSLGGNVMRKVLSSVLIGVTSLALLSTTVIAASAATTTAATKCNAIDAPKSMNDMPASADCPTPGAVLHSNLAPAATPVQATSPISSTPLAFDRTNGDLLAITKISGTNDIAFGGNFTSVFTPDGVSHPAVNFAVVDETTGAIIYAGNPSNSVTPSDNYVRAIASLNGVIYVGGDFDGWDGVARPASRCSRPRHISRVVGQLQLAPVARWSCSRPGSRQQCGLHGRRLRGAGRPSTPPRGPRSGRSTVPAAPCTRSCSTRARSSWAACSRRTTGTPSTAWSRSRPPTAR